MIWANITDLSCQEKGSNLDAILCSHAVCVVIDI